MLDNFMVPGLILTMADVRQEKHTHTQIHYRCKEKKGKTQFYIFQVSGRRGVFSEYFGLVLIS